MDDSLLLQSFLALDNKAQRAIRKMVNSPFFNQREDVLLLWQHLSKMKHKKQQDWSKEKAHKAVYSNTKYQEKRIRYCMHFLLSIIREYLVNQELQESPALKQELLSRAFMKLGIEKAFLKNNQQALEQLNQQAYRSSDYHLQTYQIHFERYQFINRRKRVSKQLFDEVEYQFSQFTILKTLQLACLLSTHQNVKSTISGHLSLLPAVLQIIEQKDFQLTPAISLYYHLYLVLTSEEDSSKFILLKKELQQNAQLFPPAEIRDLYLLSINYCIKQLNKGDRAFIKEAFDLYQDGLQREALLDDGVLSTFTYSNILQLGLSLKQYDWVQKFLYEYKSLLPKAEQENTFRYNLAVFHFRKPDFDEAMEILQQVEFQDVFYNLDARRMLLQIYYERNASEALDSLLDSFSIYLRRHQKEIGYHHANYKNLIQLVRLMSRSNLRAVEVRSTLIEKIQNTKVVAERDWLLQQLA